MTDERFANDGGNEMMSESAVPQRIGPKCNVLQRNLCVQRTHVALTSDVRSPALRFCKLDLAMTLGVARAILVGTGIEAMRA